MPSLLDELITSLSDESQSLSGILLKMKVFLHQIGKKELGDWVKHELGGYPDGEALPEYRKLPSRLLANASNIAWRATAHPLPTSHLPDFMRDYCEKAPMVQSISMIEHWVSGDNSDISRPVPMEWNGKLNEALTPGTQVEQAWCATPIAAVKNVLAQVRSRLLDFLLELKDSVGDLDRPEEMKEKVRAIDASGLFHNAVFGANTTILIGDRSSITATQINNASDMAEVANELVSKLRAALPTSNLSPAVQAEVSGGLGELEDAAMAEKPDVGRMRKSLEFLQRSFEGAVGNLIATGALTTITNLLARTPGG